ncbi:pyrethroid hydrolase Ces2a-like [Tachypleus tridentatus]|uniref:pyrethroid hydrolase Ces2a-like n=1 Tax=Tachypleus tridentatus TaxID=6853 RepID=UPI003FD31EEF
MSKDPPISDIMSLLRTPYRPYSHLDDEDDFLRHYQQEVETRKKNQCSRAIPLTIFGIAVVLVTVIVACFTTTGFSAQDDENYQIDASVGPLSSWKQFVTVHTKCGNYEGGVESEAFVFKGIPYAVPPVGEYRWKHSIPLAEDKERCKPYYHVQAKTFGSPCVQLNPYTKEYEGQEDCLYLNVWTPKLDREANLDVMVWIHGGFLQFGSGHHPGLCPSGKLAQMMNIVFVSFNYRILAMGYLALDLFTGTNSTNSRNAGNFGLSDQITALKWIHDNIKDFGGDPKKVTLFGGDAGGASILAMMSSPVSKKLFQKAWLTGPALIFRRTFAEANRHNEAFFLRRSNCTDQTCLRELSAQNVIKFYLGKDDPSFRIRDQNDLPIQGIYPEQLVIVGGDELPKSPIEAIEAQDIANIPLLIGTSSQAVEFWPGPDDLRHWSWRRYKKYVTTSLDSFGPSIAQLTLQLYNTSDTSFGTIEELYTTMVSDLRQTCPVNQLVFAYTRNLNSSVYRYIVTSQPSKFVKAYDYKALYSFHLWDVIAFFDQLEYYIKNPSKEDHAFRYLVGDIVMNFVKSDNLTAEYPEWFNFPKSFALLAENISVVDSYHSTECKFWKMQGLTRYAWVS